MSRMSPIPEDLTFASHTAARRAWDPTSTDAQIERQVKIRSCLDLATVLLTVPSAYRGVLSDLFARHTDKLEQKDQITRAKVKLERLEKNGEVPFTYNSMKLPTLQKRKGMTTQWNETWNLPGLQVVKDAKKALMQMEYNLLSKELEVLTTSIEERATVPEAWSALTDAFNQRGSTDAYEVVVDNSVDWPGQLGSNVVKKSGFNPLKAELQALQVDLPTYFRKVTDLKLDLIERTHGKGKKKAEEKRAVDVEMQEIASSSNTEAQTAINKEVQRQVAAAIKALKIPSAPSSSKQKVGGKWFSYHENPTHASLDQRQVSPQEDEAGHHHEGQEEGEEGESQRDSQGESPGARRKTEAPSWRRKQAEENWRIRELKREAEGRVEALKGKPWTFGVPSSYPDEILSLPHTYQVEVLMSRAPVALLDSNRFRSSVHVQPGLDVPLAIQHDLSASLKFMFETKIDKDLIQNAYTDLMRRLRWKWHFNFEGGDGEDYDPDYDISKESKKKKEPMRAHSHIERGLRAGQDYVSEVMTSLPAMDKVKKVPIPLNLKRAREFMVTNNLIVTSTDKNLGVAVFKREWIKSQADALFGNEEDYDEGSPDAAVAYLSNIARAVRELCDIHLSDHKQLSTFMSHCIPDEESVNEWTNWKKFVPEAYAIPKIHKNPWKGRPICPGYCLPQNPASKVLAKTIRPFIDQVPWVIRGSKDFVQKLAKIRVPPGRKAWIVSADVVAFYPSVDTNKLKEILNKFAENTLIPKDAQEWGELLPQDFEETRLDYYDRLFAIALAAPIMTVNDSIYLQKRGLPMGAAGSPDAANIYGYWYEVEWMDKVTDNDDILFYGRYLDDIFSIVLAETADEARDLLSFISLGDVKLLWEPPSDTANFLDLSTKIARGWLNISRTLRESHVP
jgi:hypothetical protein